MRFVDTDLQEDDDAFLEDSFLPAERFDQPDANAVLTRGEGIYRS